MAATQVASGAKIWSKLAELKDSDYQPARNVDIGVGTADIQPRTRFAGIFFVTCIDPSNCLYIQDDVLYSAGQTDLFQGKLLEEIGRKAAKAEWAIDLYKIVMNVMMTLALPLKAAGYTVKAISAIIFFEKHSKEIKLAYNDFKSTVILLKRLVQKYPKLAAAMLAVALESSLSKLKSAARKEGVLKLIDEAIDWSEFVEDLAIGIAKLLKGFLKGNQAAAATTAAWLTNNGLLMVRNAADAAYGIFKGLKAWRSMPKKPGVKDKGALTLELVKEFAKAGVTLTSGEAGEIIDESSNDEDRATTLHGLKWQANILSARVEKLFEAANKELFV